MALKVLNKTIPEAQYVRRTITLRDMELPRDVALTKQSLLRWFALSTGLITEQESRSTIIPILDALLHFQAKGKSPSIADIKEYLDGEGWGMRSKGSDVREQEVTEKAIRYHMSKLCDAGLAEVSERRYRFLRNPDKPELSSSIRFSLENATRGPISRAERAFVLLLESYR